MPQYIQELKYADNECNQSPSAASFLGVPSSWQDDPEISTMDIFIVQSNK